MLRLILFALFSTIYAGNVVRSNYKFSSLADRWLKLHQLPATWHEARLRCQAEGAVLVSPSTITLRQAIIEHVSLESGTDYTIFTGFHGTFSIDYTSREGVPLSKMSIADASVQLYNLMNSESCIIMTMENNGTLFDAKCTDVHPYVCYMKKTAINKCGTHDAEYKLFPETGSCYKFHRRGQTWWEAFMTCAAEGGHLAIINSEQESHLLKALFAENPYNVITAYWPEAAAVGFHDWAKRGTWLTILGETLEQTGFDRFGDGEPNNHTCPVDKGEFCGSMLRSGKLNDICCNIEMPFICEKKPGTLESDIEDAFDESGEKNID